MNHVRLSVCRHLCALHQTDECSVTKYHEMLRIREEGEIGCPSQEELPRGAMLIFIEAATFL